MALIVEDGTGLATAESYISVANALTYLQSRGDATFAALQTSQQEVLLRLATDFMVGYYRDRWKGWRQSLLQALDWPRYGVILHDFGPDYGAGYMLDGTGYALPTNQVPQDVARACADLALIANTGPLVPNLKNIVKRRKVDVIETDYDPSSPVFTLYTAVARKLAPYMQPQTAGGMLWLERS